MGLAQQGVYDALDAFAAKGLFNHLLPSAVGTARGALSFASGPTNPGTTVLSSISEAFNFFQITSSVTTTYTFSYGCQAYSCAVTGIQNE